MTSRKHYAQTYRHTLVCSVCGAKRKSSKPPASDYAAKKCRRCHLDEQRILMEAIMGRRGLTGPHLIKQVHRAFTIASASRSNEAQTPPSSGTA